MNINRKYIIIFGTLILLLVFITGAITYYKEKGKQVQTPDIKQHALSLSRDYPASLNELSDFIGFCKNGVFSDTEELKDSEIKEVVCTIVREARRFVVNGETRLVSAHIPLFSQLASIISFNYDCYTGISVDLKDIVKKYDPSLLEKDKLYFCSISEPLWEDRRYLQIAPEQNLFFPEGSIGCAELIMDKTPAITFSGFIPESDLLNIKLYLVDKQIISDVMSKKSFSGIEGILKDYPIIWQMEKPINNPLVTH
jgi:hypothetical protein